MRAGCINWALSANHWQRQFLEDSLLQQTWTVRAFRGDPGWVECLRRSPASVWAHSESFVARAIRQGLLTVASIVRTSQLSPPITSRAPGVLLEVLGALILRLMRCMIHEIIKLVKCHIMGIRCQAGRLCHLYNNYEPSRRVAMTMTMVASLSRVPSAVLLG
jgi:hypothetical protein